MMAPRILNVRSLVLVRHGQSVLNEHATGFCFEDNRHRERAGIVNDRLCPLTPRGHRQALAAGRALRKLIGVPACILHSGFTRTLRTAQLIRSAYPSEEQPLIPLVENNLVRERNSGYLSMMTRAEIADWFPWNQDMWRSRDPFTVIPVGGESMASMVEGRLFRFLEELALFQCPMPDPVVVVVSHGRSIQGLRYLLEGWDHDRMNHELRHGNHPANCSITSYSFDSSGCAHVRSAQKVFGKRH